MGREAGVREWRLVAEHERAAHERRARRPGCASRGAMLRLDLAADTSTGPQASSGMSSPNEP